MNENLRWFQPAFWLRGMIRVYQRLVSSRTGSNCRYLPTCSSYAIDALETHGAARGGWLATKRVLSCNPWSTGGFEHQPVPLKEPAKQTQPEPVDA